MPLYYPEKQQHQQRPVGPIIGGSKPHDNRQQHHNPNRSNYQQNQTQEHAWPLQPSRFAIMIRTLPGGSAWLDRLEFDPITRLRFLRRLHKLYTLPLLQLPPTNKERAAAIAEHIEELEALLQGDDGMHLNRKPLREEPIEPSASRESIMRSHPQAAYNERNKHKRSIHDTTLTEKNLAVLQVDSQPQRRQQHSFNSSYPRSPSTGHLTPAQRTPSQALLTETRYRIPSKAHRQQISETFRQKRQGQIDAESTHLRRPAQFNPINANKRHPIQNSTRNNHQNSNRGVLYSRGETTSWAPSSTFATVGGKASYQDRLSRGSSSRRPVTSRGDSKDLRPGIRVKDV